MRGSVPRAWRAAMAGGLLLLLAACGHPTAYQPEADGYGYGEQQIAEDRFRVSFSGNSLTDRVTVENYLLYRAAEVTLNSGNEYFVIVTKETEKETREYNTFGGYPRFGYYGYGCCPSRSGIGVGFSTGFPYGGSTQRTSKYTVYADIRVIPGPIPPSDENALRAIDVIGRLGNSIVREYPES
ncbi:CC0125/CC1285 family lipoprotein [Oceanibacterium hippocampi]|uniref:CC0125/CC1285 family lipoprotein n=1 Tax=Oceanibacterium hippocampi TaxID=745714 RepID=UPI001593EC41|nr:hypothetical protein [Oceanibacterium hippocampi]